MAMPVPIFPWPTPQLHTRGLFTSTVTEVPWNLRYGGGVTFQPLDLTDLDLVAVPLDGCTEESDPTSLARECITAVVQTAFNVMDSFKAPAREYTWEEMQADIDRRWPLVISEAIAREFLAGAGGSNHNLTADGVGATTPANVAGGIAELEEDMALGLGNTLGYIHMTPSALVYAVQNGVVVFNGGRYYSPGGHLIVADSGYQVAETTTTVMYGTGQVFWALDNRLPRMDSPVDGMTLSALKNQLYLLEQAYGIIIFDPNTVYKTTATKA